LRDRTPAASAVPLRKLLIAPPAYGALHACGDDRCERARRENLLGRAEGTAMGQMSEIAAGQMATTAAAICGRKSCSPPTPPVRASVKLDSRPEHGRQHVKGQGYDECDSA